MALVVLAFYKRRPDFSQEAYIAYWRDVHGPMLRDSPVIRRYLARYVQHDLRRNDAQPSFGTLDFDGMSEVWYKEGADRAALLAEPYFTDVVVPDEANFIDMTQTRYSMYSQPIVQLG